MEFNKTKLQQLVKDNIIICKLTREQSRDLLSDNNNTISINIVDNTNIPHTNSRFTYKNLRKINPYLFGQIIKTACFAVYGRRDYEYTTDSDICDSFEEIKKFVDYDGNIDLYYYVCNGVITTFDGDFSQGESSETFQISIKS